MHNIAFRNYIFITNKGFTYIEIVMSIFILAAVSFYLVMTIPTGYLITNNTENITKATEIAQRYIEQAKVELSDTNKFNSIAEGTDPPLPITDKITNYGQFDVTTNIVFVGPTDNTDSLKQITVNFKIAGTSNIITSLSSIIAKPPGTL